MEIFSAFGLGGMFLSAFLAATVLPLSSEVVLTVLLASGYAPLPVVAVATIGNVLGAVVNYWLGMAGSDWLGRNLTESDDNTLVRARKRFKSWGTVSLLLAWMPVIGDPLTVVAGIMKVNLMVFIFLVSIGKLLRYVILAGFWVF